MKRTIGERFIEITPTPLPLRVEQGASPLQMRLLHGAPDDCEIKGSEIHQACVIAAALRDPL
jgi:hypothetical protein